MTNPPIMPFDRSIIIYTMRYMFNFSNIGVYHVVQYIMDLIPELNSSFRKQLLHEIENAKEDAEQLSNSKYIGNESSHKEWMRLAIALEKGVKILPSWECGKCDKNSVTIRDGEQVCVICD